MKAIRLCDGDRFFKVYSPEVLAAIGETAEWDERVYKKEDLLTKEGLRAAAEAEFIFSTWGMPHFEADEVERYFPKLRAVFYAAGTVQQFAREFLDKGIAVFSAWAANAVPVAEMAASEILLANKGFYQSMTKFREQGRTAAGEYCAGFPGTYDTTVGLIGIGMVGAETARLLQAYRLRVLAFDPFLSDERAAALGLTKCGLPTLFAESQTISNHLANNPQTVGMLNYALFRLMKPNATFINTGRGAQVAEDELVRALRECPDRTAVLDVTMPEPPEEGHPFYTMPNVFLTPHIAGSMGREVVRMSEYMLREFKNFVAGQPTRYGVTLKMLETMA